jgi:hypothetical protein
LAFSSIRRVVKLTWEFITKPMHQNSSSIPSAFRFTLKLKPGTRRSAREAKTPPPRPQSKLGQKPGAAWSEELNQRMQADMDALMTR